jgi:hypothetical protein
VAWAVAGRVVELLADSGQTVHEPTRFITAQMERLVGATEIGNVIHERAA